MQNIQLSSNTDEKIIGKLIWDTVDVLTFGALEKKNNGKPPNTSNNTVYNNSRPPEKPQ